MSRRRDAVWTEPCQLLAPGDQFQPVIVAENKHISEILSHLHLIWFADSGLFATICSVIIIY